MTIDISANNPRISYSVAAGVTQTSFAVPFEFFDDSDLNVYIDTTLQTITTNYTVTGGAGSTGTVTMSVTGPKTVILTRDTTIERTTDFTAGVDINRAALNTQLDTLTAISADNKDLGERSIRITDYDPVSSNLLLPDAATRADKLISFDTEGDIQVQAASDLLTGSILGANYTKASYTGDGTQTAYSTVVSAGSKNNIQVYVNGVYQNKNTFSISGSTLTFTAAPSLNSAIEFIVGNAITSLTTDPDVVTYNQGSTGAQDRILTSKLQDIVSVKDFGAVGNGVTDDTSAFQAAVNTLDKVYIPEGNYKITSQITLPVGSGGQAWSTDKSFHVYGAGMDKTKITFTGSSGFVFATTGMDGTVDTQYLGATFEDFEIQGPASGTASGLGIAHTRMATFRRLFIRGFPDGAGIKLYAEDTGGMYNSAIEYCQLGTRVKPNGSAGYSLTDDLYPNCLRYGIWLRGANGSGSGVNDSIIIGNQIKNILESCIFVKGHGTPSSGNDSTANMRSIANHFFAKPARDVEAKTASAGTSTTVTFPSTLNTAADSYNGFRVYIDGGTGSGQTRTISDDTGVSGGSRTITVSSAFDTTPDNTSEIQIRWGDSAADTEFTNEYYPNGIYFENVVRCKSIGDHFEDLSCPVYIGSDTGDELGFVNSHFENTDGVRIVHESTHVEAGLLLGTRYRGNEAYNTTNILTGLTMARSETDLSDTDDLFFRDYGFVARCINKSGSTLNDNEVVVQKTAGVSQGLRVETTTTTDDDLPMVIVSKGGSAADNAITTYAMSGSVVDVEVDTAAVALNDTIVTSTTATKGKANNSQTDPKKIIGYAMSEKSSGSVGVVKVRIL